MCPPDVRRDVGPAHKILADCVHAVINMVHSGSIDGGMAKAGNFWIAFRVDKLAVEVLEYVRMYVSTLALDLDLGPTET